MRRLLQRLLLALGVAAGGVRAGIDAGHDRPGPAAEAPEEERTVHYETGGPRWAEPVVAGLLLAAAALFVTFLVLLLTEPQTQLLALALGGGFSLLAAALIVAGSRVVPRETAIEPRPALPNPQERESAAGYVVHGADGVSRRRLLAGAAGTAGAALGAAVISVPLTQAGPGAGALNGTPWRAGLGLVDDQGAPIMADALDVGGFLTAFPAGADPRELGSPVVVVRVDPATIVPPRGREQWSPRGLMAFSKICTHAGCAVTLFRSPASEEFSERPALVCPCHYSTFDVRHGAQVVFGPAGRPLPQLPLQISASGALEAGGPLSGSVGPAWWGTER